MRIAYGKKIEVFFDKKYEKIKRYDFCVISFLYYRKVLRTSYNINTLHRNLHKANFTREQRRGLKNVLISDNVSNVRFCSLAWSQ